MSYSKDREAFVFRMALTGNRLGLYEIRQILKHAGIVQRAAEIDCSVSDETIRENARKASQRASLAIRSELSGSGWGATFHGDPRGYVVHLTHSVHNEIGVPAQGYRASQIERMSERSVRS